MVRPNLINLNHVELKCYPFMISLEKCTGSCNVLSPKICVSKETKDINVKAFNMITNKNKAKAMTKHISCNCANSVTEHIIQIKNGIIKDASVNVKIIVHAKRIIDGNLAHVFVRIAII